MAELLYSYLGIRAPARGRGDAVPFGSACDHNDDDDDGAGAAGGAARREVEVTRNPVHIAAVVNLTARTAGFAHVAPLPGQSPAVGRPLRQPLSRCGCAWPTGPA